MNPDNPYAAPQTVEPQLAADESLPVAALVGRQRYPDVDTAILEKLAKQSRAIEGPESLWITLLVNAICLTLFLLIFARTLSQYLVLLLIIDGVLIYRTYVSTARRTLDRFIILFIDGLLLVVVIGLCYNALASGLSDPSWDYLFGIVMLSLPAWILVRSIRATLLAPVLFGPTPYLDGELTAEVEYRRANKIE